MSSMGARAPVSKNVDDGQKVEYETLLSLLERIAWDVNELLDTEAVLQRIVSSVVEYTPWTICWAGLFHPTRDDVTIQYDSGLWNDLDDPADWTLAGSPSLEALCLGAPLAVENIQEDRRFPLVSADARERGYRSVLVIPLRTGGVRGALWLCGPTSRVHSQAEVAFGRVLGALTAIALQNVQLVDQERRLRVERESELVAVRELKEIAERQNAALSMLAVTHERLLRTVLDGGGFGQLAITISELVRRPVFLIDQFGDMISGSGTLPGEPQNLSERLRVLSRDALKDMDAMRPGTLDIDGSKFTASPVVLDGVTFGYLWVEQGDHDIDELEVRVLDQAALVVALEFLKERIRLGAELSNQRDFGLLLAGGDAKESHLRSRAARLGLNLDTPSRMLRVRLRMGSSGLRDVTPVAILIQRRLRVVAESARVLPLADGDLAVFVPDDMNGRLQNSDRVVELVRSVAAEASMFSFGTKPDGIMVGISNPGVGAANLQESFVQATRCLEVMNALSRMDGSLSIDDAGSYTLLVEVDRERQEAFSKRVLQKLEDYDSKHRSDLVTTLDVFLDHFGNVQKTAETLFLHQTTVRYRLSRIEELSNYMLSNAEDRLRLQIALRLRRLSREGA
jgi:PucR family transcriptional regulator, purine catabolism regulatory protein